MLARDAQAQWEESAERILAEARFSPWLKHHLKRALARPPLEALEDAEILRAILRGRLGEEACGDPLAEVPLAACDPLAAADPDAARPRAAAPRSAESLLREAAALLPREKFGAALLFLDAAERVVVRGVVTGDGDLGAALGELFARALRQGARSLVLVQSAAVVGAESSAWSLLRKRVVEIASLLGVIVEDLERRSP